MKLEMLRTRVQYLRVAVLALTAALVATVATVATGAPVARADAPLPDGLTETTAAASCWEIKQNTPTAPSGVYWLVTPALVYPQQFYCDQTTDGGGWVLIARGREGWTTNYHGSRTPAEIRNTPAGTGAFRPAQLPSATVDGLLNGGRVDGLADGIRIRRAADVNGNSWQEVRFKFSKRDRWVWSLGAEHRVGSFSFTAVGSGSTRTGSGGQTNNFGADNGWYRLNTSEAQNQGWTIGMAYGPNITGSTSATSYLWSNSAGVGNARPFAQMYVRPQLRLADLEFETVPSGGTPAQSQAPIAESAALRTVWGVSGFGNGQGGELNTEVAAFAEIDGVVYVGGNFRYVQRDAAGTGQVQQPFLAAFDADSGEWISTFRPQLNGQVKALYGLPDGRLAVGGQFSNVGGTHQTALAFLNAATGALQGDQVQAENRSTGGTPYVRGFDYHDGYLYVSGNFTHLVSLATGTAGSSWNGGRLAIANSRPDTNWNAFLNGTSVGVDASPQGDRVYFSGYFKMKQNAYTPSAAAIQTTAGAPLVPQTWKPTFSKATWQQDGTVSGNVWQFGVAEAGGRVYLGGSEHSIFGYDRNDFSLKSGSITKAGGDFQVIYAGGDSEANVVYGGCHCGHWTYENAFTWDNVGTNWTQGDAISLFGAWDAVSGDYLPRFAPQLSARAGYGVWALFQDSRGTLWVGGDLSRSVRSGGVAQWSGGFVRYGMADTSAPTTPSDLVASPGPETVTLQWSGSTDDRGGVVYEVLQDGRVIASTSQTSAVVLAMPDTTQYAVRARDGAENRSASTPPIEVVGASDVVTMISDGDAWRYRWSGSAWPTGWNEPGFDTSSWPSGTGLFGVNAPGQATNLDAAQISPRPLSAQFVHTFELSDPHELDSVTISVVADDGVVVWVNGTEVGRVRMPSGTLNANSYATGVVSTSSALANRAVFDVPASLLVDGTNVVAASTHANYRATPNLSFDLSMTGVRGDATPPPTAVVGLEAVEVSATSVELRWGPGSGTAPHTYVVTRDGETIAEVPANQSAYVDQAVEAERTYLYGVIPVGPWSLAGPVSTLSITTPAGETPPSAVIDLTATADSHDAVSLSWAPGQGTPPARFLVLRDGVEVADVTETTFSEAGLEPATSYEYSVIPVSAAGAVGTASLVTVTTKPDPHVSLVADSSVWSWRWTNDPWPAGWYEPGFDASDWKVGEALFGVNAPGQVTNLNAENITPRPLSAQFIQEFEVEDAGALETVTLSVVGDDGVVVWVNGVEIGRVRMPGGTVTHNTYPTAAISSATALANRSVFEVPVSLLHDGTNVVAASMHANYRATPNLSFQLSIDGVRGG